MKIHGALMCQDELYDLSANVRAMLPYVDDVTIVDGGSKDGSINFFRNYSIQDPRVRYFIHPWKDNFPEQRNNVLRRVGEVAQPGDWILFVDPDEYLDENALQNLRELARVVPQKRERYARVAFQCRSESYRGFERVFANRDSYWKGLFYRWTPEVRYSHNGEGAVHETLIGADPVYCCGHHPEFPALFYSHRKQENVTHPRGLRNLYIGGGGKNEGSKNPRWVELRAIADRLGLKTWHAFYTYLIAGNIDVALRDWFIRYRHITGFDGSSEHREGYKTYFRLLHPEEEPAEFRGEAIE